VKRPSRSVLLLALALSLAGAAGYLGASALGSTAAPARTVTINVATGPRGPAGPPGPPGPAGLACPSGFEPGELVIDHPGGQVRIWTCLHG